MYRRYIINIIYVKNNQFQFHHITNHAKIIQLLLSITVILCQSTDLKDDLIISSSCDEELKLPAYNQNEMGHMVHVALYLRKLILEHPLNEKAELTEETAYESVPEALYVFLALMYGGLVLLKLMQRT